MKSGKDVENLCECWSVPVRFLQFFNVSLSLFVLWAFKRIASMKPKTHNVSLCCILNNIVNECPCAHFNWPIADLYKRKLDISLWTVQSIIWDYNLYSQIINHSCNCNRTYLGCIDELNRSKNFENVFYFQEVVWTSFAFINKRFIFLDFYSI